MNNRVGYILNKIMFGVSGLFLVILLVGLIKAPFIVKKMEGSNYLFSDKIEMQMFETILNENGIPYEVLSDTGVSISDDWKRQAEIIYEEFMEAENNG